MTDPLRTIIVDDERLARQALLDFLGRRDDIQVVATCADGHEAIRAIDEHDPDLVFLDIRMPEIDGFAVLEGMESARMPTVIFVTAHDDFALEAFNAAAVDYVLKPFDDERLARALDRARRMANGDPDRAVAVRRSAPTAGPPEGGHASRVKVRDGEHIQFVRVDEVEWFESDGNYVVLHQGENEPRIRSTLAGLEEALDPRRFVRVHRSAIINLDFLKEVQPWFSGDYLAIMIGGQHIRVSRRYKDQLLRDIF